MSREREHDEPIIPGWNDELNKWPDYCRRVRLCHAQTVRKKRYTLGPRLVLKLSGRAWEVAASLDHSQLTTNSGAQYLLSYLRERLGRLPIPDMGQHLDDLFVRFLGAAKFVRPTRRFNDHWQGQQLARKLLPWVSETSKFTNHKFYLNLTIYTKIYLNFRSKCKFTW